ncbi:MAG: FHA domain-containing protein [Deltaproteobacteria bacterium]|nr:FHA domain-containing protein [Deltaproteobacteria bacterium]
MELLPQIKLKNRKTSEKHLYRLDQNQILMGRDAGNYIVLPSKMVSRRHAEIIIEGKQFFIRDLKSNNGTLLNEKRLPPKEKTLLRNGDLIQIEEFDLQFHQPMAGEENLFDSFSESTDTDLLEIKMLKKLLKVMDKESAPSLEVLEGPQGGKRFVFDQKNQDVVIGRDPACEFQIESDIISRKHAKIEKRFETVTLVDLSSKNGTYVNREKVTSKKLQDGDIIHLGTLTLSFKNPQELTFELEAPQVKPVKKEPEKIPEEPRPSGPHPEGSRPPQPAARSSKRRENPPPAKEPQPPMNIAMPPDEPFESEVEETPTPSFNLSKGEIFAILIGLLVLVGSLWGILKLLK